MLMKIMHTRVRVHFGLGCILVKGAVELGCVVGMVVDSIISHAVCGPNDYRKGAPPFRVRVN